MNQTSWPAWIFLGLLSAIIIKMIMSSNRQNKLKILSNNSLKKDGWEFGDEWKSKNTVDEENDGSWKEVFCESQLHNRPRREIFEQQPFLNLSLIQKKLSENNIQSRVYPSTMSSLYNVNAVYVKENDIEKAFALIKKLNLP